MRVHASSANPVDNAIAAGMLKDMVEHEFPVTLGRDYAGVVEQVGADVTRYAVGDEVFGFLAARQPDRPRRELGRAHRRLARTCPSRRAPAGVDLATAGAAPLAGITAMAAIDALELSEGDTVLIVGATGGVGSLAVQLAAQAGATVVAPALPEDEEYLRDLGVSELLPRDGDVAAAAASAIPKASTRCSTWSPTRPAPSTPLLKDGGRVASPLGAAGDGPGRTNVMAAPTRREPGAPRPPAGRWHAARADPGRPTSSRRRPTRSPRSPPPTRRASSPSASADRPLTKLTQPCEKLATGQILVSTRVSTGARAVRPPIPRG